MKFLPLSIVLLTNIYAEWGLDIFQKSTELYDQTREKTIQIYKDTLKTLAPETVPPEQMKNERLEQAWDNVVEELREGTRYIDQRKSVPESAWIARDRADVEEDVNRLFDRIVKGLVGESLETNQKEMAALREKIDKNREQILLFREKRIGAPRTSTLHTTKTQYDEKIETLKQENRILENDIRILKAQLQQRFADIGVTLSMAQIEVLLTRVDGSDIIRIAMVMDTLKYITLQIQKLMKESGEELIQAKRYYGMHQVLLELVVYIQQQYIDKCNHVYIPRIRNIIRQAEQMIEHTEYLKKEEEERKRAAVYAHNIDALKWTLEVAKRYEADLVASREKMKEAQKVAMANLNVSRNTYETVSLSSDLYDLISESQEMFTAVSKIQVPDIIPFSNLQIKKKYSEITRQIR
jgi:hypothetical protein